VTEQAWRAGRGGATRTLYLGLPLLVGLSADELRAVISHEMAHYAGGHARTSMLMHRGVVTLSPTFLLPQGLPSDLIFTTVTVRQGDTLSLIACRHSTTVAALQAFNHLGSSTTIQVGEHLTVPNLPTATAACG
jgi:Zn-dependent protease with chaperone function